MNNKQKKALKAKFSDDLADSENPMEPVNEIHRYLSGFVGSHRGFSRDGLQDWLNLFYFYWNTPGDSFQKAQAFIELEAKKRKILRYRSWGKAKNSDKSRNTYPSRANKCLKIKGFGKLKL